MPIDTNIVRRLAFIKYLYKVGVSQSTKPEPLCSSSLLVFHDSVELFLQLACEVLDVGRSRISFMEYWEVLSPALPSASLPQKESMRRLNKSRVALKHHGTLPSKLDIDFFKTMVTNFFEDATPIIFVMAFAEISLVDFVQVDDARESLREAAAFLASEEYPKAISNAALAFHQLVNDYERRKIHGFGHSPFHFGGDSAYLDSFHRILEYDPDQLIATPQFQRQLGSFVDSVKESIEAIQNALRILAMGIDYPRYARFRLLSPRVVRNIKGKYLVSSPKEDTTDEEAQFCIDFVIETALGLQQFDYTIEGDKTQAA